MPRHETLRATLDWSHNMLSEAERMLFRRLAVFAGTFAADAAVQVCGDEQSGADAALAVLTTLVEKSLVEVHIERQEARYRLLEPIRQYAWQRLVLEHETDLLQRRHAEYYVGVAEEAAPQLTSVVQRGPAIGRLTSDLDNVRAALSWCQLSPEPAGVELGLRLGAALNWFWRFRGELSEGLDRLTDLLGRTDGPGTSGRAGALCAAGELAWFLGQNELARSHLEKSATLYRTLGDKRGLAYALQLLAVPVDPLTGQRLAAESLRLFEEQGDAWGVARTTSVLAVLRPTEPERERAVEDALARWRTLGDRWAIAQHLNFLGDMARHQGRDARAEACYREALDVLNEADLPGMVPRLVHNLGYLALRGGHARRALRLFQESMALFRDQGEQSGLADSLEGVAIGIGEQGQAECAARLFGAAARLREAIHARPWPGNAADVSLGMGRVRDRLDEASFDAAWVAGRALSSEQVLREVLALG